MEHLQTISPAIPVYIIGAGGIVNTAHLPAYQKAGYRVAGIYDIDITKAEDTASRFQLPVVFDTLDAMVKAAPATCVFDIAIPGASVVSVLSLLPQHSFVLIQKPMGEDLNGAKKILAMAKEKNMTAAINFQLRYAPAVLELKKMISEGAIGQLTDIEVNVNVYTPWQLWDFLFTSPRVEILYHSIHYIDLVRNLLGDPVTVYAKTTRHPEMNKLASVRSNIIMDYGDMLRANILTNHAHVYGPDEQQAYIKAEGTKGAVKIDLGALRDYPVGIPDRFSYTIYDKENPKGWKERSLNGNWFPDAFIGSMHQVMMAAMNKIKTPDNSVEDCIKTMACVEAAYQSSQQGGIIPDYGTV